MRPRSGRPMLRSLPNGVHSWRALSYLPLVITPRFSARITCRVRVPPAYSRASTDGSRPAQFLVNLARSERMSVADAVAHEAYPGHHLQHIAELRAPLAHPVMGTLFFGGFVEGWGIYAETLGDEMS